MALQIFGHPHQHSQAARRSTRARAYHCYLRNSLYAIKIARRWTILILLPKPIIEFELPEEIKNKYKKLREPVSRLRKALYGLRRSGFDFINALRKTLIEDGWSAVEGDPAVLVLRNGQSHKNVAVCAHMLTTYWGVLQRLLKRASGTNSVKVFVLIHLGLLKNSWALFPKLSN